MDVIVCPHCAGYGELDATVSVEPLEVTTEVCGLCGGTGMVGYRRRRPRKPDPKAVELALKVHRAYWGDHKRED